MHCLSSHFAHFKNRLCKRKFNFANIFDDVVDSHEVGMRKPNHAIYELSLSRLGVEAHRTAFLDDAQSNVNAATAVGMHGIWVDVDPTDAVQRVRQLADL